MQGNAPDKRSEHGSIVVYRSKFRSSMEFAGSSTVAASSDRSSAANLSSAHCSACVFPGSSRENPVANARKPSASDAGNRGRTIHPTQKAVLVASHWLARRNESIMQSECATCSSDGNDSQDIVGGVEPIDEIGGDRGSDGGEDGDLGRRCSCGRGWLLVVGLAELKFECPDPRLVGLANGISGATLGPRGRASASDDDGSAVVAVEGAGEVVVRGLGTSS